MMGIVPQTTHPRQAPMHNISERLRFLIATEEMPDTPAEGGEAKRGEARTLAMLERRTGIPASRWRDFTRGKSRANEELIEAACKLWPWFTTWLATGHALMVENLSPFSNQPDEVAGDEDIVLKRAKSPDDENTISIPHRLKLRTPDAHGSIEPLTSDTMEWGYFGAGPCELAANVLFHFGLDEQKSKDLRTKFAKDVVSNLNRHDARIQAATVREWIKKQT
jgi:hypothetical protein